MKEAYERKKLGYETIAAEAETHGCKMKVQPVEVGCMGFTGSSAVWLLKEVGMGRQSLPL